jgi:hypothetical protein
MVSLAPFGDAWWEIERVGEALGEELAEGI